MNYKEETEKMYDIIFPLKRQFQWKSEQRLIKKRFHKKVSQRAPKSQKRSEIKSKSLPSVKLPQININK